MRIIYIYIYVYIDYTCRRWRRIRTGLLARRVSANSSFFRAGICISRGVLFDAREEVKRLYTRLDLSMSVCMLECVKSTLLTRSSALLTRARIRLITRAKISAGLYTHASPNTSRVVAHRIPVISGLALSPPSPRRYSFSINDHPLSSAAWFMPPRK